MKNRSMIMPAHINNNNNNSGIVTEWEDNILFDADDPDFCNVPPNVTNVLSSSTAVTVVTAGCGQLQATAASAAAAFMGSHGNSGGIGQDELAALSNSLKALHFKIPHNPTMSMAGVHGPQFADVCSPLGRSSISMSSSLSDLVGSPLEISVDNVLTIEDLRQQMGSCFTCGVSWTDDHVSLDCSECGGYSLERPCPLCDGKCGVQWKRDFTMSHACGKARWHGVCPSYPEVAAHLNAAVTTAAPASCAAAATQLRLAQELCARLEQLSPQAHT